MAPLTPDQRRKRDRVEALIRLTAPGLNLVLAAGERLSRLVERDDPEYHPARQTDDAQPPAAPPGSKPR